MSKFGLVNITSMSKFGLVNITSMSKFGLVNITRKSKLSHIIAVMRLKLCRLHKWLYEAKLGCFIVNTRSLLNNWCITLFKYRVQILLYFNYDCNTRHFVIFRSYLLSFFKTLKLALETIIGKTICSVTFILFNFYTNIHS